MSQESATEAYEALVRWLRENKLDWVAQQIEEEAVLGKTELKRIATSDTKVSPVVGTFRDAAEITSGSAPPKRQSAEFLVRVDYSPYEKFDIAVSAVRAVVIGAIEIQDALATALNIGNGQICFVPGETGVIEHQYRVSDLTTQRSIIVHAEDYLKQLTEDVNK
ncbi:hypothetical protein [Bradyrhizobium sp. S69]|uniref:hypothetical protein n=1 Tax=Bradyrhizobium sp. S69 TaxID=1641856 RepID=UPI00131E82B7|nr:hypothetical protein [Bradyrhizobium sp. S69]